MRANTIIKKVIFISFGAVVLWNILVVSIGYFYQFEDQNPVSTALVLGAGVLSDGSMSDYLRDRVDAAIILYDNDQVENILVSGDNSRFDYDEVEPVKEYLLDKGVFSGDIYLDHAGFDTYDSLYRAKHVFGQDRLVVISQGYHVPRAVTIGRMLGIQAYGYASPQYHGTIKYRLREIASRVKILYDFVFLNEPRFEGDPIEIK